MKAADETPVISVSQFASDYSYRSTARRLARGSACERPLFFTNLEQDCRRQNSALASKVLELSITGGRAGSSRFAVARHFHRPSLSGCYWLEGRFGNPGA